MKMGSRITEAVSVWFHGKYTLPENDPDSILVLSGHFKRHWTAKAIGAIGYFVVSEWKWLLGTAIALLAIYSNYALRH